MSSGQDLATEYADTMVESIAGIMARYAGEAHDDECEGFTYIMPGMQACQCQERAHDELVESYALEVVAEVGEPYSVLLTYGGPTAWVEWAGRLDTQSAELHVTWSSEPVARRSSAIRALAEFYAETMGDQ